MPINPLPAFRALVERYAPDGWAIVPLLDAKTELPAIVVSEVSSGTEGKLAEPMTDGVAEMQATFYAARQQDVAEAAQVVGRALDAPQSIAIQTTDDARYELRGAMPGRRRVIYDDQINAWAVALPVSVFIGDYRR